MPVPFELFRKILRCNLDCQDWAKLPLRGTHTSANSDKFDFTKLISACPRDVTSSNGPSKSYTCTLITDGGSSIASNSNISARFGGISLADCRQIYSKTQCFYATKNSAVQIYNFLLIHSYVEDDRV